jgi:hypothetical protein
MNIWDLPDPNDLPEDQMNDYYRQKIYGGMDTEKGDKDDGITEEEMENIERFLKQLDKQSHPPSLDDDI